MEFMQILNAIELNHFGQTYDISLNWIGQIIEWLISGIGYVGLGIIVFSLLLKLIVLPLDIYQRVVMRKQNNKMQENQAKMEKLQKQYANDKEKYNQKVMEMYRENGISMFSSCLPMILSMVVFFSAIGGFNAYSKYANIQNYNGFVQAYNRAIESYAPAAEDLSEDMLTYVWYEATDDEEAKGVITVKQDEKAVYYTIETTENLTETSKANLVLYVKAALAYENGYTSVEQEWKSISVGKVKYYADVDKTFALNPQLTATENAKDNEDIVLNYYSEQAREAVRKDYEDNSFDRVGFLWVKNVWNVDAAYEHPLTTHENMMVPVKSLFSEESKFNVNGKLVNFTDVQNINASPYHLNSFNEVTKNLKDAKEGANGYFILIALSIGTILLQQIITIRSQKAQNKYSSVDGQQAATQKTTMIIMTVMFGIFAFMYSAAFSIYMVISSVFSLFSTMLINKIVDVVMNKKEEQAMQARMNRTAPGKKNNEQGKDNKPKKSNKENKNK